MFQNVSEFHLQIFRGFRVQITVTKILSDIPILQQAKIASYF